MDKSKSTQAQMKITLVLLHQAVNFVSDDGMPAGNSKTSFNSKDYQLEPHPMGVKVKKSKDDKVGMILTSANIKQILFIEE